MISPDQAHRFAVRWIEAWNRHDVAGVLSHYADDVEWSSPFIPRLLGEPSGVLRGKAAVRAYVERGLERYPDLQFELLGVFPGVSSVTLHYRIVNRLLAAEVFEFGDSGLIRRVLCHYAEPT